MTFNPTDFSGWCEQDVREGIIAKLLEELEYEKGSKNDVLRGEQLKLEYDKEIWQAYSYAKHHEVRAVMYCVCNGKELKIFRTDFAPGTALVKEFKYEAFETEFDNIASILSPDVIRKTWPIIEIDSGKPLGKGLRSFAQVVGGTFAYQSMSSPHSLMRGMRMPVLADSLFTIVSGFVERSNDKLRVVVITRSPSIEGQRISESIGIDRMELWSDAAQISDNPNEATIFSYTATYTIPPARTGMLGIPRYSNPIPCSVTTTVRAYLEGSVIKGDFDASMRLAIANQSIPVTIRGTLEANID